MMGGGLSLAGGGEIAECASNLSRPRVHPQISQILSRKWNGPIRWGESGRLILERERPKASGHLDEDLAPLDLDRIGQGMEVGVHPTLPGLQVVVVPVPGADY